MKKLMIAAAIALVAVASQAAVAVTWSTGTGVKDVNGDAFATTEKNYVATILFATDSEMKNVLAAGGSLSASTYSTKGSKGFGGQVTGETFNPGKYYAQITLTDKVSGKTWTSDIGSFTIGEGVLSGPAINFTTGDNMGGSSLINNKPYSGGTDPTPEPTTGLLMLVGLAGLALRRKQA